MLISKQQQFMLEILQRLGCVRKEQLASLLRARFFPEGRTFPPDYVDTLLRQFRYCGIELCADADVVSLPGKAVYRKLLEAIDVMLELSQCQPLEFWAVEKGSVLLRFSTSGKRINLFAVLHADDLKAPYVRAPPALGSDERVVIILSQEEPPTMLPIPNALFYALRQEDGTYRFYAKENT